MGDPFSDAARKLPHRTEPRPLHFPVEQKVPETGIHLLLRTFLFQLLTRYLRGRALVGSDQFVYFDASDPRRCLAPDVFAKWNADVAIEAVTSWKIWERGAPELCIEIDSSDDEPTWPRRFAHYRALGVRELVRFDPAAQAGKRIRVWDRIDDDLVERTVEADNTPCVQLGLYWVVREIEGASVALRLAEDAAGERLVPSPIEASEAARREEERARREEERARHEEARARREEERARIAAEQRIVELEAELRRRSGQ